ncbi:MAG TPA: ABC transporter permease subunit [Aggregatilineaceae bacterium]|nr:ABC transporter permease subunit [Aggregatilineaceae bacterium]
MGTWAIFRSLWKFWNSPNFPLYLYQEGRHTIIETPWIADLNALLKRMVRPFLLCVGGAIALVAFLSLCGFASYFNSIPMFSLCFGIVAAIFLFIVILVIFLWPVPVAIAASGSIADDREHLTWELLLATPIERSDILLAKLAHSQRQINAYAELLFWVQGLLVVLIFILIIAKLGETRHMGLIEGLLTLFLIVFSMFEFGTARLQDYILAGLIGVGASLLAGSRQAALLMAFMGAIALVLLRGLITVVLMQMIPGQQVPPAQMIFFATGPSSLVVLTLPSILALAVLVAMPVLRELAIRAGFRWLVNHMGEMGHTSTIQ